MKLLSLECVAVAFADIADSASCRGRSQLVHGLGAVLVEIGCRRLILAAYHTQRLDLCDLMALVDVASSVGQLRVEVSFHRASNLRCRQVRMRR
ncbi:MAG TPA: hypothetical protein VG937_27190 [Polyangiaceae bacterium]|nr:hypothetical protein [Polyangiaceae bacterium]